MKVRLRVERSAYAGAQYGLVLAGLFFGANLVSPRYGLRILWPLLAVHLGIGGVILLRRTHLRLAAFALFLGSANLFILGQLQGFTGPTTVRWPLRWWAWVGAVVVVMGLFMRLDRYIHADEWADWDRYMADKTGWDILLMRHIPDLRGAERRRVS